MLRFLDHLEEWLIGALMAAATLLIFVAVIHRYGMGIEALQPYLQHIHLSWAQELCIYMFVWMAKHDELGAGVVLHAVDQHVNADVNAGALFTAIIGTLGANFVWEIAHTEQTSADLELPMWLVYLAVPCGSYLMCFRFLQVTFSFIRTGELPKHDHSHVEGMDEQTDDINWFAMDDNLHPHGVAHDKREGK